MADYREILPLAVCLTALVIAVLVLGMIATGLRNTAGASAPAWSGKQAPPGTVGLSFEHRALAGSAGSGKGTVVH